MILFITSFALCAFISLIVFVISLLLDNPDLRFSFKELCCQLLLLLVVSGICTSITYFRNTYDTQIIAGEISSKTREEVRCRHDYCCGYCTTTTCSGSNSCSTSTYCCHTCYEHSYDVDWNYTTDFGYKRGQGSIATVDRQGLVEPLRWSEIRIHEPAYTDISYTNYIKASPDSLFSHRDDAVVEKFNKFIPPYPENSFDYYKAQRFISVGATVLDHRDWETAVDEINRVLGPSKQTVVMLVFVESLPETFFYALRKRWLGGKKNDFVVVIGVSKGKVTWTRIMAWSNTHLAEVAIENKMASTKIIPREVTSMIRDEIIRGYKRKRMHDFEYLMSTITPSPLQFTISLIIQLLVLGGLTAFFLIADPFDDDNVTTTCPAAPFYTYKKGNQTKPNKGEYEL